MSDSDGEEYEVEAVVGRRTKNGTLEYLLEWKGYDEKTWTPVDECACTDLIAEYEAANPPATPRETRNGGKAASAKKTPKARESARSSNKKSTGGGGARYRETSGTPEGWRNPEFQEKSPEKVRERTMIGANPMASTKLMPTFTKTGRSVPKKRSRQSSDEEDGKSDSDDGSVTGKRASRDKTKKKIQPKRAKKGSDDSEDNASDGSESINTYCARTLPGTSRQRVPKLMPKKVFKKLNGGKADKSRSASREVSIEWEVESIDGRRKNDGNLEYLLKWKNSDEKTWTPIEDCGCKELIDDFEKAHPQTPAKGKAGKPAESDDDTSPIAATPKRGVKAAKKRSREAAKTPESADDSDDGIIQLSDDDDLATRRAKRKTEKKRKSNAPVVQVTDDSDDGSEIQSPRNKKKKTTKNGVIEISDSDNDKDDSVPPKRECRSARVSKSARSAAKSLSDDDDEEEEEEEEASVQRSSRSAKKPIRTNLRLTGGDAEGSVDGSIGRSKQSPKKKNDKRAASPDSDNDEADTPRTSRSAKKPASSSAAKTNGKADAKTKKAVSPSASPPQPSPAKRRPSLETVLNSLLDESETMQDAAPVRLFQPEQLPGIKVWTEAAFVDEGYDLNESTRAVEKFRGRVVECVVGFVPHPTYPFVLAKMAVRADAVHVSDLIQAVHSRLASKTMPKAFSAYMNRVAQLSQEAADDEGDTAAVNNAGNGKAKKK